MGFLPAINVVVAGATAEFATYLLYKMCDGCVFGTNQLLRLSLLDLPSKRSELKALRAELQRCCFPLLDVLVVTVDPPTAFKDADVAVLLTAKVSSMYSMSNEELQRNVKVFRNHGLALEKFAKKTVLVVIANGGPAASCNGAMAAVCSKSAPSIPSANFTGVSRILQKWASAEVASHIGLSAACVDGALIWGNSWGQNFLPDFNHATITLPEKLARLGNRKRPAREVIADDLWLKRELHQLLMKRQTLQIDSKPVQYNLCASIAIIDHIHDLWIGTEQGRTVSMAIFSDGSHDVPEGLMFSMPTQIKDHSWEIAQVHIDAFVELSIKRMVQELESETRKALKIWEQEELA